MNLYAKNRHFWAHSFCNLSKNMRVKRRHLWNPVEKLQFNFCITLSSDDPNKHTAQFSVHLFSCQTPLCLLPLGTQKRRQTPSVLK
jgi:hypothetical protein